MSTSPALEKGNEKDLIRIICEECGSKIKAPYEYAGSQGNCPKCRHVITVPVAGSTGVGNDSPAMNHDHAADSTKNLGAKSETRDSHTRHSAENWIGMKQFSSVRGFGYITIGVVAVSLFCLIWMVFLKDPNSSQARAKIKRAKAAEVKTAVVANINTATKKHVWVTVNIANLRRDPGLKSQKIGKVEYGSQLDYLGSDPSGAWIEVTSGLSTAWIYSKLVSDSKPYIIDNEIKALRPDWASAFFYKKTSTGFENTLEGSEIQMSLSSYAYSDEPLVAKSVQEAVTNFKNKYGIVACSAFIEASGFGNLFDEPLTMKIKPKPYWYVKTSTGYEDTEIGQNLLQALYQAEVEGDVYYLQFVQRSSEKFVANYGYRDFIRFMTQAGYRHMLH